MKLNNLILIRSGQVVCITGAVCLLLPLPACFSLIGLILIGLGCTPIYPCTLHETLNRFGKTASQSIMALQMAFAYIGSKFRLYVNRLVAFKTHKT